MAVHVPPRIYRRVPFETTVRLCYDRFRGFVEENSANLSLGGLFIATDERPPVGTELSIEFRLEDGFELIRGTGRVAWVRDEPAGDDLPPGIGIRFLELTPGSRELIFRLVDRRVKEGKTPFDLDEAAPDKAAAAAGAAAAGGPLDGPNTPRDAAPADGPLPSPWSGSTAAPGVLAGELAAEAAGDAPTEPPREDPRPARPARDLPPPAEEPPRDEPPPADEPEAPPAPPREEPPPADDDPAAPPRPVRGEPWQVGAAAPVASVPVQRLDEKVDKRTADVSAETSAPGEPASSRRSAPRWGRVAVAAGIVLLLLAAGGLWWGQRAGVLGTENAGGVLGPLPLRPDELAEGPAAPDALDTTSPLAGPAAASLAGDGALPAAGAAGAEDAGEEPAAVPAAVEIAETPGRAPTRLENLTWSAGGGRTDVLLWTNGAVGPGSYSHFRIAGERPRLVVRLRGIEQPYTRGQVEVDTPQLARVRTGFHSDRRPSELHVVLDLPAPGVELASIEGVGGRLRVVLEGP